MVFGKLNTADRNQTEETFNRCQGNSRLFHNIQGLQKHAVLQYPSKHSIFGWSILHPSKSFCFRGLDNLHRLYVILHHHIDILHRRNVILLCHKEGLHHRGVTLLRDQVNLLCYGVILLGYNLILLHHSVILLHLWERLLYRKERLLCLNVSLAYRTVRLLRGNVSRQCFDLMYLLSIVVWNLFREERKRRSDRYARCWDGHRSPYADIPAVCVVNLMGERRMD
jgi:hypothetical protein